MSKANRARRRKITYNGPLNYNVPLVSTAMDSTCESLLYRLRTPGEGAAWERFVDLYTPMIASWARRQQLALADADDLVQEVMTLLLTKLPEFKYDGSRSFRGWLRTITTNKARDFYRRRAARPDQANAGGDHDIAVNGQVDFLAEEEYRAHLVGRALQLMKAEFQPNTWKACWKMVVEGQPAEVIAREFGMSANAVYIAKSRVLRRLREELAGLLD